MSQGGEDVSPRHKGKCVCFAQRTEQGRESGLERRVCSAVQKILEGEVVVGRSDIILFIC
jgi:hypothetical protein